MSLINELRALWRMQSSGGVSSWGQGGASDHARSMRYGDAIDMGLSPEMAASLRDQSMGGTSISLDPGSEPTDVQLLQWATVTPAMSGRRGNRVLGRRNPRSSGGGSQAPNASVLENLIQEYQSAIDEANSANDARSQEVRKLLEERRDRAVSTLEDIRQTNVDRLSGTGTADDALLRERFQEALSGQLANLSASGLGGSTVGSAFAARNKRDLELALAAQRDRRAQQVAQVDASLGQQVAATDAALSGDVARFIENQSDVAPDMGQLAELAMRYGQGGGGRSSSPTNDSPALPASSGPVAYGVAPRFVGNPVQMSFGPVGPNNNLAAARTRARLAGEAQNAMTPEALARAAAYQEQRRARLAPSVTPEQAAFNRSAMQFMRAEDKQARQALQNRREQVAASVLNALGHGTRDGMRAYQQLAAGRSLDPSILSLLEMRGFDMNILKGLVQ